jgi:RimJ/RimL family protein N-acetyltransferase
VPDAPYISAVRMKEFALRFDNARAALRQHGAVKYSRRLMLHFLEFAYRQHAATIFRRDLTEPVPILDAGIPLQFEVYSTPRHDDLHAFLDSHVRRDLIEARLRNVWTPMLAYYRGKLVSVSWFATRPLYLESLECHMDYGAECGYIEGSRTDESLRGMGIAPAIRSRICSHLRALGCKEAYVCVGDDNTASQAVARKCGFAPFESIVLTRILWHRHYHRDIFNGSKVRTH